MSPDVTRPQTVKKIEKLVVTVTVTVKVMT